MISTFLLCVVIVAYVRLTIRYRKLQQLHESLLVDSMNQLIEYWEFRRKFEEYRARFDPIDTTRDGNVITIKRGKHE